MSAMALLVCTRNSNTVKQALTTACMHVTCHPQIQKCDERRGFAGVYPELKYTKASPHHCVYACPLPPTDPEM